MTAFVEVARVVTRKGQARPARTSQFGFADQALSFPFGSVGSSGRACIVIVDLISNTTTSTGLTVHCTLDTGS